eukprot:scaffold18040_cov63-Phaeocystis_antarctica.AAC.7
MAPLAGLRGLRVRQGDGPRLAAALPGLARGDPPRERRDRSDHRALLADPRDRAGDGHMARAQPRCREDHRPVDGARDGEVALQDGRRVHTRRPRRERALIDAHGRGGVRGGDGARGGGLARGRDERLRESDPQAHRRAAGRRAAARAAAAGGAAQATHGARGRGRRQAAHTERLQPAAHGDGARLPDRLDALLGDQAPLAPRACGQGP